MPQSFSWLADLNKSQSYTTCDWSNPARSVDFGFDGYTSSLSDWHELLQLTAPDPYCGIVFIRGNFPNTADAILSRAQRRDHTGEKGTFGLEVVPDGSDFVLGEKRSQGLVNFRWPYIQCELRRKTEDGGVGEESCGTYEALSFVKDRIVYQIVCVRLATGLGISTGTDTGSIITFRIGGRIQLGCLCSAATPPDGKQILLSTEPNLEVKDLGTMRLGCISNRYQKSLEMQLFVNDECKSIGNRAVQAEQGLVNDGMLDLSTTEQIELKSSDPTIIVSTYALQDIEGSQPSLSKESFTGIEEYLGIPVRSQRMTDRLWTACLTTNYDAVEAVEFCVIGRSVEQILCVSSTTMSPSRPTDRSHLVDDNNTWSSESKNMSSVRQKDQNRDGQNRQEDMSGIALLRNVIGTQYVDLQSTFWQIRLLVKVHAFLETRKFKEDLLESMLSLNKIRSSYLSYLRKQIRRALVWILEAKIERGKLLLPVEGGVIPEIAENNPRHGQVRRCQRHRKMIKLDRSYNQAYFVTLTIWFVMQHCPDVITTDLKTRLLWPKLRMIYELSERRDAEDIEESTSTNDVLRWFHLSCLLLICQQTSGRVSNGLIIDGFTAIGLEREVIRKAQEKCEKSVTRLRKSRIEINSDEDEEVDRLFLIGDELKFQLLRSSTAASLVEARAEQARTKIYERKPTTIINPGPISVKQGKISGTILAGPWELRCLNHHSLLRTALDNSSETSPQASRDICFRFLLSDYTFMTSWDRADSSMVEKWWDFEPSSVISATLLDLKIEGKLKSAESESHAETLKRTRSIVVESLFEGDSELNTTGAGNSDAAILRHIFSEFLTQLEQKLAQKDVGQSVSTKTFDWLAYKPGLTYHPRSWVQSLETKPMNQTLPQHQQIIKFLSSGDIHKESQSLEWHISQDPALSQGHLQFLIVFELSLSQDLTFRQEAIHFQKPFKSASATSNSPNNSLSSGRNSEQDSTEKSMASLSRSLVDSSTKYRVLFAERCCPPVVHAFIRGWHPDAVDAFENYFGISSQFADSREDIWTTTITISHWSIRSSRLPKDTLLLFKEHRKIGPFPPEKVASLGVEQSKSGNEDLNPPVEILEQRSTSLVITGDLLGCFWLCSIWSPLTDFHSLETQVKSLREIIQLFIHQQAAGRCLVFLILLGHLCEKLAKEYEAIMFVLNQSVGLGETVLTDGLDWETAITVAKLKKMVWGLETLQLFDERLSSSLSQIRSARESLEHTIEQETGQQHIELLQGQKNVLEEFTKRYGILSDVQARIQLRIRQITGLRDGISTVTNVVDSRTALEDSKITIKQGNNIRVLTLITILYLPLGFVTALFSVTRGIIPDDAGGTLYAVLVVVCMIATFTLALSLGLILNAILPWWDALKRRFFGEHDEEERKGSDGNSEEKSRSRQSSDKGAAFNSGRDRPSRLPALLRLNGVAGKEKRDRDAAV